MARSMTIADEDEILRFAQDDTVKQLGGIRNKSGRTDGRISLSKCIMKPGVRVDITKERKA